MPCSEKRARLLLARGRARVHQRFPFAIRLIDRTADTCLFQPLEIKGDPGSKVTGLALVRKSEVVNKDTGEVRTRIAVLSLFELVHRGRQISEALTQRRGFRRRRRGKLRYRAPRFDNRTKPEGWLPPSLRHRVDTTTAWVARLRRLAPVVSIAQELVRFDTQAMQNPEIAGVEYQQGELQGYEVREYLLEKFDRTCAYCDAQNVPFNLDHVHPKARGGSNRVSNLALACLPCNEEKGKRAVEDFLAQDPARLAKVKAQIKRPLKDAAAVNSTRWALFVALKQTGLPVDVATGGRTKWNRSRLGIPKAHALDAVCVGNVDEVTGWQKPTLVIKCTGRGSYKRTRLDKHGFPRGYLMREKSVKGFRTGDLARAEVPSGKKAGVHQGRLAVRASGSFDIQTADGVVQGIWYKRCRLLQRSDGYGYSLRPTTKQKEAALPLPSDLLRKCTRGVRA